MSGQGQAPGQAPVQEQVKGRVYYDAQEEVRDQVEVRDRSPLRWDRDRGSQARDTNLAIRFHHSRRNHEAIAALFGLEGLTGFRLLDAIRKVEE